jgi:hypothetical protein
VVSRQNRQNLQQKSSFNTFFLYWYIQAASIGKEM